jgi:hypothetical protein
MGEFIVFAVLASLNPTLVAATTMMLLLERPARLMVGFLLGALTASISLGLVFVFSLSGSGAAHATQHGISPGTDLALGGLALVIAYALRSNRVDAVRERRRARRATKPDKGPPRWQRELSKGSPRTTFAIGAVLSLPGASYIIALDRLRRLHYPATATIVLVVAFNIVQMWLLEIPLIGLVTAPDWTQRAIDRAKGWVGRHGRTAAVRGLTVVGLLLIVRGTIELA